MSIDELVAEEKELLKLFNEQFEKLNKQDRNSVQLAIASFAMAYQELPYARKIGMSVIEYMNIATQLLQQARIQNLAIQDAEMQKGLWLLTELQGCSRKGDKYVPTDIGDKAITYLLLKTRKNGSAGN